MQDPSNPNTSSQATQVLQIASKCKTSLTLTNGTEDNTRCGY